MAYVHMQWNWKQGPNKSLHSELVFVGGTRYPHKIHHKMTGVMDNESAVYQNAGHRVSRSESASTVTIAHVSLARRGLIWMQHEWQTDSEAIQKLDTANFTIKRMRKKLFVNDCKCNSLTARCWTVSHINMGYIILLRWKINMYQWKFEVIQGATQKF